MVLVPESLLGSQSPAYAGTQGAMPVREETYAAPAPPPAPPVAPPQWQGGGYQMGPGHPSYPSNPESAGAWPSMPQWPSDVNGWPADPRASSGGYDTADVWVPSRGQGGGGGGGNWSGDNGLPKRPTGEQPPFQPPQNWSFGDRAVESSPPPRPRYDFPETESAATGPIPVVKPASSGDEYLPIFASVESAWFEHGESGASWGSSKADAGWSAAEAVVEPARDGATASGLPKRVPKANLVPGSADTASAPKGVAPMPSVSPDRVRSRLSSFQQGFRAARDDISEGRAYPPGSRPVDSREEGA
jgi:hypothetical protein